MRVRGVGVSVTGTIQPKVLARVLTEEFRASGFLARLLLALPPWRKRQWTEAEVDEPTRAAFAELLEQLYRVPAGVWPDGKPAPHLVRLSDPAKALFVAFYNANGAALETADEDMSARGTPCGSRSSSTAAGSGSSPRTRRSRPTTWPRRSR